MADDAHLELKIPMSLDERNVRHFADKTEKEPDVVLEALADAVEVARISAEQLVQLATVTRQDTTMTFGAQALAIRNSATARAERVAGKLDAALAKAKGTIAGIEHASSSPPVPRDAPSIALCTEIRASLKALSRKERMDVVEQAFAKKQLQIVGSVLSAPAFLSGFSDAECEMLRGRYASAFYPKEVARRERLLKATEAVERAGSAFMLLTQAAVDNKSANAAHVAKQTRQAIIDAQTDTDN